MKNLKAVILIASFLAFWLWIAFRVYLSFVQPPMGEVDNLNNNIKIVVEEHNKVNHSLREANIRIRELEDANEALINACGPSVFRKASQNTPLPKMKEA